MGAYDIYDRESRDSEAGRPWLGAGSGAAATGATGATGAAAGAVVVMGDGADALSPLVGINPVITPTPTRLAAVTDTAAMPINGLIFAASDMFFSICKLKLIPGCLFRRVFSDYCN